MSAKTKISVEQATNGRFRSTEGIVIHQLGQQHVSSDKFEEYVDLMKKEIVHFMSDVTCEKLESFDGAVFIFETTVTNFNQTASALGYLINELAQIDLSVSTFTV